MGHAGSIAEGGVGVVSGRVKAVLAGCGAANQKSRFFNRLPLAPCQHPQDISFYSRFLGHLTVVRGAVVGSSVTGGGAFWVLL